MNALSAIVDPIRSIDLERWAPFRPSYPPVAVEIDRHEMVLVRVRRKRGKSSLEAHRVEELPDHAVGQSIFRPNIGSADEMTRRLRTLFEATGTRPGKVSLILPDNLAKVSLMTLPERPASRRQLQELLRFKLRRAVPFRLEDAVLSYQVLTSEGTATTLLVAVMLRSVVEQYERLLDAVGARPGLVDLCTPSLFNLCRHDMIAAAKNGGDAALLNCSHSYFSLMIVRGEKLIFYRCKSFLSGDERRAGGNGAMERELNSSISYYQEKLEGQGLGTVYVRSLARPFEEMAEALGRLGVERVLPVDPGKVLALAEGLRLDPEVGQRIAPALGSAAGRTS